MTADRKNPGGTRETGDVGATHASPLPGLHNLKPYSAYKDSGVLWLGEVPAHWEVLPNRATFSEMNVRENPQEQMLSVTIAEGVVRQKELLEDSSGRIAHAWTRPPTSSLSRAMSLTTRCGRGREPLAYRSTEASSVQLMCATASERRALTLPALSAEDTSVCERSGAMVIRHNFGHVEPST